MHTPALERTSAAKSGWLIIVLTTGWMVFVLWPGPPEASVPRSVPIPVPVSSLTRAGLREYTDWEGLPEIFAIWADRAEWKDNRTRFAYWHPVMKNYSYFFEASRTAQGYRFREIAEPHEPNHDWDESLGNDCPIRFYRSTVAKSSKESARITTSAKEIMDGLKPKPEAPSVVIPIKPAAKP